MADLVLDDVSASDKTETLDNDQYNEHITLSANKIGYPSAGLQFEKVAGDVPLNNIVKRIYQQDFAQHHLWGFMQHTFNVSYI